jgi:hypothetical protein
MSSDKNTAPPTTYQANLAKLPRALAPLIERPQWAIWRPTQRPGGGWQKPPFQARNPQRNASTSDPSTWTDYATALAAVQAGNGEGLTYILTKDDPFAAVDMDHCRDIVTGSVDVWAQLMSTGQLRRPRLRRFISTATVVVDTASTRSSISLLTVHRLTVIAATYFT